jgi:hypothetical protein
LSVKENIEPVRLEIELETRNPGIFVLDWRCLEYLTGGAKLYELDMQ